MKLKLRLTLVLAVIMATAPRLLMADVHMILMAKGHQFQVEASQVQTAVLNYYTEYGSYPVAAENATLMKILTMAGPQGNPRGIVFIRFPADHFNTKGELVDPWGTAIQLAVLSNGTVLARSAGPDRVFGTADDIGNDNPVSGSR